MVWFPDWSTTPIRGVSFSASGLLALADLSTVAQRTAIAGGSRWMDALILAPGLHYQQAADELAKQQNLLAVDEEDGRPVTMHIHNAATANYISRIARPGQVVTLHVGALALMGKGATRSRYRFRRSDSGNHATVWAIDDIPDLGWISHLLYLTSPFLTAAAIIFDTLLQDWWALALVLALMLSRILNIWVIKQRSMHLVSGPPYPSSDPSPLEPSSSSQPPTCPALTEYRVQLGNASVRLRGTAEDLRAITADAWLRAKTKIEGYLEAAAKLVVYLVAALSGNMTQAGQIVQMILLLTTAGLLALSNAEARSFRMRGRVAAPAPPELGGGGAEGGGGTGDDGQNTGHGKRTGDGGAVGGTTVLTSTGPFADVEWDQVSPDLTDDSRLGRRLRNERTMQRDQHSHLNGQTRWSGDDYGTKKTDSWPDNGETETTTTDSLGNDHYYEGGRNHKSGNGNRRGREGEVYMGPGQSYHSGMDDWAERGQLRHAPFQGTDREQLGKVVM